MQNTTKNSERIELIVGLCTIGVAVVLLVALIIGMRYITAQLSFSTPSQEPPTMQSSTLPLPTPPALIPNPYNSRDFAYENGYLTCISGESWLGVDVSEYQGTVDWEKVASQNIRFAMIRMGARAWGSKGQILTDSRWKENLSGAKNAGLKVGVYFFSQAISVAEAKEEARFVLEKLEGQALDLPIVFDWEFAPAEDARTANVTAEMFNSCAIAFCEEVKAAGYQPMVYFNPDLARRMMDLPLMQAQGYPFWLAMYSNTMTFPYRVDMWQYTSGGTVLGIEGFVDIDLMFFYD